MKYVMFVMIFRIKTMFCSSLPLVVCRKAYLPYLCLCTYSGVRYILCCVFDLFVFVVCAVFCQFLWIVHFFIASSVFSNVYLKQLNLIISSLDHSFSWITISELIFRFVVVLSSRIPRIPC